SNDLLRKISSFQNKLCLCFDNANKNNDKPVLFLSDISKQCYNQLININEIARYYSTIKVPHHGTPSYFIDNLPESENLLIPNDNKRKTWLISSDYFITYSSRNIFPNLPCSHLNRLKSRNSSGVPDYFCTHYLCI
ncbi:MAG: hypothetical protein K2J83_01575, partial [Clostridia bacterium]|nr:hypothetical protein [Clostridia bacterium]